MTGEEIVALIKEFFNMILNFLIAVGIIKADDEGQTVTSSDA